MSRWDSVEDLEEELVEASEPDLNAIRISIAGLRNLAIEMMKEGLEEIGLKDLLYRIQTMYREGKD